MQALLYCNLSTRGVSDQLSGSPFTWPRIVAGDHITLGLRFAERLDGQAVEVSRVVRQLRASVGRLDARPVQGTYRLKLGDGSPQENINLTGGIPFDSTASQMANAFNGVAALVATHGEASVEQVDGSYLVRFGNGETAVEISAFANSLLPISFVRVIPVLFDGKWLHDIRLIQAGVAFTTAFDRIVPPAPTVTELQNGGEDAGTMWNEIQRLFVPPDFRGTYQLRRGFRKSGLLSREDGPDEIAAAIAPLADEDGEFIVTNPSGNTAHIEFAGSMEGSNQPLLEVSVFDAPEGDLTFTLSLNTPEMRSLMRQAEGEFATETTPAVTGLNFKDITWHPTPILAHRFFVTHTATAHTFGCRIRRSAADAISCSRILYGGEEGGVSGPSTANFAIRARLERFDTRDSVSDPRGLVALLGLDRDIVSDASEDRGIGTAFIR